MISTKNRIVLMLFWAIVSVSLLLFHPSLSRALKSDSQRDLCDPVSPVRQANWAPKCVPAPIHHRRAKHRSCVHSRMGGGHGYCGEITSEEREYIDNVSQDRFGDILTYLKDQVGKEEQAICGPNNGVLVNGTPVLPSYMNRIRVQTPERCTYFGTYAMAGMLEWLGREVSKNYSSPEYSKGHILIGDIAAPRGGCLGHSSHYTGEDADIGLLTMHPNQSSPTHFHRQFDADQNWWFIKKILNNPIACIKVIFLGREHIAKLAKRFSRIDPEWSRLHRYVQYVPGHSNHIHVRIGSGPGPLGCGAHPEEERNRQKLEEDEWDEDPEGRQRDILLEVQELLSNSGNRDVLGTSQSSPLQQ